MTRGRVLLSVVALAAPCGVTTSAGAIPPPVTLDVTLVTPSGHPNTATRLSASVQSLVRRDYLALGSEPVLAQLPIACFGDGGCAELDALRTKAGQRVLVLAHDPTWRSADHQVRCVGPDRARSQDARVNLSDAVEGTLEVSHQQLVHLSSCMIGAIYASPRK